MHQIFFIESHSKQLQSEENIENTSFNAAYNIHTHNFSADKLTTTWILTTHNPSLENEHNNFTGRQCYRFTKNKGCSPPLAKIRHLISVSSSYLNKTQLWLQYCIGTLHLSPCHTTTLRTQHLSGAPSLHTASKNVHSETHPLFNSTSSWLCKALPFLKSLFKRATTTSPAQRALLHRPRKYSGRLQRWHCSLMRPHMSNTHLASPHSELCLLKLDTMKRAKAHSTLTQLRNSELKTCIYSLINRYIYKLEFPHCQCICWLLELH